MLRVPGDERENIEPYSSTLYFPRGFQFFSDLAGVSERQHFNTPMRVVLYQDAYFQSTGTRTRGQLLILQACMPLMSLRIWAERRTYRKAARSGGL